MKTIVGAKVVQFNTMNLVEANVVIDGDTIIEVGSSIKGEKILGNGKVLIPGLIDVHVHLREPGFEHKATFASEGKACAKGGFTHVFAMPNTSPAPDTLENYYHIKELSKKAGIHVTLIGSATTGGLGHDLSPVKELYNAGVTVFSDDGKPIMKPDIMQKVMKEIAKMNASLLLHEEDLSTFEIGVINRGEVSKKIGIDGIPNRAESNMVERDINFAKGVGAHLHFCHMSTKESIALIREAKAQGLNISCEVAPHHFSYTEREVERVGSFAKVNPPLRTQSDIDAMIDGLKDGTIDCIATDHAPHDLRSKIVAIEKGAYGLSGIEFSLGLGIKNLVQAGHLSFVELIQKMSQAPAKLFHLQSEGEIKVGNQANLVLVDIDETEKVTLDNILSMGKNTPVIGEELPGVVEWTMFKGELVYEKINR